MEISVVSVIRSANIGILTVIKSHAVINVVRKQFLSCTELI